MNLDMTDSIGPGKLVHHMQNLAYTYDSYLICMGLGPSIVSVIDKNLSYSGPSYPSSPVFNFLVIFHLPWLLQQLCQWSPSLWWEYLWFSCPHTFSTGLCSPETRIGKSWSRDSVPEFKGKIIGGLPRDNNLVVMLTRKKSKVITTNQELWW